MEPTLYFATRPDVPSVGTDDYNRWKKESTLNFPGGYITATYGNLIQTFAMTGTGACDGVQSSVSRRSHTRTNVIGGDSKTIGATSFTVTKYPKRNSTGAAAGQAITISTAVGSYSARLGGDIQDFAGWLCSDGGKSQIYDTVNFTSGHGAHYGPFGPAAQSEE